MNKSENRKIISFLLTFSMIFSLFMPTIEVLAEEKLEVLKEETLLEGDSNEEATEEKLDEKEVEENNELSEEENERGETKEVVEIEEKEVADVDKKDVKIEEKKVTILGTTDLHGRFVSYDYATNSDVNGGLDQVATIVNEERVKDPNLLLVDNGDTVQGNYNHLFKGKENPMVKAMTTIGYDIFSFGNHEFNSGLDEINNFMTNGVNNSKLNFLCANLYKDGKRVYKPYTIKEVNGVKVAIIGVVSPNIVNWDAAHLKGHETTAPDKEVTKAIKEIKEKNGGADLYFVTGHVGLNNEYGNGDSAKDIANNNPEVSGVIAGHSHSTVEAENVKNAVISQPKNNGESVSKFEFTLRNDGSGYKVVNKTASLISTKGKEKNPTLVNVLKPFHEVALKDANGVIGTLDNDLAEPNEVNGIPQSAVTDQGITDFINKVQLYYSDKELKKLDNYDSKAYHVSGAALLDAKSNLKAGDITKAGIAGIYKYDNKLYTIETTGKQLKKYLEWTAEFFNTYKEGDLTISFNEDVRFYNYDMLDGIKYDINISKSVGNRIENISFEIDGKKVEDTDKVYLTVNDYRYNTVLNATVFDEGEHLKVLDTTNDTLSDVRDMIAEYIKTVVNGNLAREVDNNWKITGNDWDAKQRELAVKAINEGKVKLPTSEDGRTPNVKAVTWNDVKTVYEKSINILTVNDFHGNILESGKNIGAAKLAAEVKRIKAENKNTIFVGGGDLYQGTAISNLLYGKPVSEVLKEMGMKYTAVGNHEFDWGLDKFSTWSKDIEFLASNIVDKATGNPVDWAKPYAVEEIDGVKIGLIGLATPESAYKTKPENVKTLEFKNPIEATNKWSKYLKEIEKVDVVIVVSHLGGKQDKDGVITGEIADLANGAKGVDGIIAGHSHQYIAGKVNGVPIVQSGNNGRALGNLQVNIDLDNNIKVTASYDELYKRVESLPKDEITNSIVSRYEKDLNPILSEVVATVDTELTHDRSTNGVTKLGQFMTKYMAEISEVQIALTNAGGLRKPLNEGNITVGDMWDVMPFDNTLVTMKLKGSDLKRVMEHGVMNTNVGWIQFYGLNIYYDSSKESGERISSMRLSDGTKVEMDKYYTVVTNDFMYDKGDNYDFTGAIDVKDTGVAIRDALIDKFKDIKEIKFAYNDKVAIDGEEIANPDNDQEGKPNDNEENKPNDGQGNKPNDNGENKPVDNQGSKPNNKPVEILPETGDIGVFPYGLISLLAVSTIIAINKKKKSS